MISVLDENFSSLNQYLSETKPSQLLILVDENTHNYCLPVLLGNLTTEIPFEIIEIEAGEELKTIETATHLWEIFSEFETDKKALLINLGGGVITDLGGFAASTYKRGIKFINIPTTLLGMCDASIGGKTGIDHQFLKNIVGTFAMPENIFVYKDFLKTLPFAELRSGFAEMLKHGLIADRKHWEDLTSIEEITAEHIAHFIERSMLIKQAVIEQDFKEENVRKTLNFGHTIGHALESLFLKSGENISHGECVALGMICETKLAEQDHFIESSTSEEIIHHIRKFYPYIPINKFSNPEIISLMQNDKKNFYGKIKFSLLNDIGICNFDCETDIQNINNCLDFYKALKPLQ